MNTLFSWLIPPALGAIIGFVTNVVAIKMLFRPLREVRLFGIRLPFTPGILPKQRHRLADNIGGMVERELLTPEALRDRLNQSGAEQEIKRTVAAWTEGLLSHSPVDVLRFLGNGEWGTGNSPSPQLVPILSDLVQGPGFRLVLEGLGESLAAYGRQREVLGRSFRELLGPVVWGALQTQLGKGLDRVLEKAFGSGPCREALSRGLEKVYPQAAVSFIRFLERQDIRRELEIRGQVFLSRVMLKMNVLQRFFISAGQYDKTLQDRMPEIVEDLIAQARDLTAEEAFRVRLLETLPRVILEPLSRTECRGLVSRFIMERLAALADRPLGDFFTPEDLDKAAALLPRLSSLFKAPAEGTGSAEIFTGILVQKLLERFQKVEETEAKKCSFALLLSLEGEKKELLDSFIAKKIRGLADREAAGILSSLNVRLLVSNRINSLDMLRVERIILDVMANQFKWINIFGAILGGLIGLSQSVLGLFLR